MKMHYLKIFLGIFVVLSVTRFMPPPPNFTSLIALSFYVPVFLGIRFLPAVIFSFALSDIFIGYHHLLFFTWGSVLIIGLISKYFKKNLIWRISGVLTGAFLFYIVSNFGVWILGSYGYTFDGFFKCYIAAIPFFGYSLISTVVFSLIFETIYKIYKAKNLLSYK